jgi:ketosteroid isomerase-like protein
VGSKPLATDDGPLTTGTTDKGKLLPTATGFLGGILMASASQEILEVEKAMMREFNAGDMTGVLSHFHPRVIGFSSTQQERVSGLGGMKKTFNYYRQASTHMKYRIAEPKVQLFGDTSSRGAAATC